MDNIQLDPKNYNYHDNYIDNAKARRKKLLIKIFYILAIVSGIIYFAGFLYIESEEYEGYFKLAKFVAFVFGGIAWALGVEQNKKETKDVVRKFREKNMN